VSPKTGKRGGKIVSSDQLDPQAIPLARREAPLRDVAALAASVSVALMLAAIAGLAISWSQDGWYASATNTLWNPPNHVFGPMWTVLYTLMGLSAWLVWRQPAQLERTRALRLYGGQLALGAGWPPVFFLLFDAVGGIGLWVALGWILILDFVVLAAIISFWRQSKISSLLLIPYWMWLLFATALNASLAVMNG
jgi:translocator protein